MAYYRTCPYCGSNNDPGEACDCRAETKKESAPAQRERTQAMDTRTQFTSRVEPRQEQRRCDRG